MGNLFSSYVPFEDVSDVISVEKHSDFPEQKTRKLNKCIQINDFFELKNEDAFPPEYTYTVEITNDLEEIMCNGNIFFKSSLLGEGSYGSVYLYEDISFKNKIVLKVEIDDEPNEKDISEHLMKNPQCNTIRVRYLFSRKNKHFYILDPLDGDLDQLVNKLIKSRHLINIEDIWISNIMEQVRRQVVCLYQIGLYYTDLKPMNVLYCKNFGDVNDWSVHLGDLGSASGKDNLYISTYPPPEFKELEGLVEVKSQNAKQVLTWQLGIMLLYIIDPGVIPLGHADIQALKNQEIEEYINKKVVSAPISSKNKEIILNLLTIDPIERVRNIDIETITL